MNITIPTCTSRGAFSARVPCCLCLHEKMEGLDLSAVPVPEGTTLPEELGGSDLLPDNHAGSDVVVPTAEALGALTGSLRAIDDGLASSTILKLKGCVQLCLCFLAERVRALVVGYLRVPGGCCGTC